MNFHKGVGASSSDFLFCPLVVIEDIELSSLSLSLSLLSSHEATFDIIFI